MRNGNIELDMEALKRNEVDAAEELTRMMTAVSRQLTAGSDAAFFAVSLDAIFAGSSRRVAAREANEFWDRHVYAYFNAARDAGHLEALLYEIRRPTNDPAVLAWLTQHAAEVERCLQWSAAWSR